MNVKVKKFDVIILGGGLVGLTVALLCAKQGFSVALVEKNSLTCNWSDDGFDARCSAISRRSQQILQTLGAWDHIISMRASPYRQMIIWDSEGFGEINFDAAEVAESDLGHIIENRVMIKVLWAMVAQETSIACFIAKTPVAIAIALNEAVLTLEDQTKLSAKLVIGADGAQSWLRQVLRIETERRDYHQHALVATVATELPHLETAWQRFLPEGPLAFLPLPHSNISSIVWTATLEKIKRLLQLKETLFCKELAHDFDNRLGKILWVKDRKSFALKMLHTKQYIHHRAALVGDAAHVIHPLAGQGVNLGLYDAKKLVEILSTAKQAEEDIGHYLILRKYERARKGHITATMMAMDFFNKTFSLQSTFMLGLRSFGLNVVNKTKPLKRKIILEAMGL